MQRKYSPLFSFTSDSLPTLNNMLRELFDWISKIQYDEVSDSTSTPTGGHHGEMRLLNDGTNKVLWINVEGTWTNIGQLISSIIDHTHSSTSGQGGQLDWDNIWSDAVHSHQTNAEGGKIDHGAALNGLTDDDHTQYILVNGTRAFTGAQSMGSNKLTNVTDPTLDQDAATKKYVDDNIVTDHGNLTGLTDDDHIFYRQYAFMIG